MAEHALDAGYRIDLKNVEFLGRRLALTPQRLTAKVVKTAKHPSFTSTTLQSERSHLCPSARILMNSSEKREIAGLRFHPSARWFNWLEHEFTDRKVRGSNPTSASQLPLSRLGQPASIPALVLPSGGMAADELHSEKQHLVERTRDCVRKINCNDCTKVYIGQTARELHARIGEHKMRIIKTRKYAEEYQGLDKHSEMVLNTRHRIDLEKGL
ncbi:hypothetical protein CSKR_112980 [Clonorchis sinensis]|uniref:Uncharacterized protein n=1 Tax=Clonorchis sinensis TaxID=79923 RepID=A0A419PXH5_CLOSI|nr:hypothetical protein CSKR_112980 [Clonorchis sinensis]